MFHALNRTIKAIPLFSTPSLHSKMSFSLPVVAEAGFKGAAEYDSHRPSYPPEAVSWLLNGIEVSGVSHAKIIDLAAGTGKFTELVAARPEQFEIIAVEPHDGMRGELEKKTLKSVQVKSGDSLKIPVADEWADGIIIAQV
jgi:hypothetical protein